MLRNESLDAASLRPRLQRFAAQASEAERRAMLVERDVVDVYRAIYMQDHIGEELEGRIAGFAPYGIYVQIEDPFVSVLLPFEQLDDTFEPDDLGIRLIGARTSKIFTMNDPVTVRVEDVNVQTRDVVGSLLDHHVAEAPTEARRRQRRPDEKRQAQRPRGQKPRRNEPRKRKRQTRKR
jgi:ribonuclease R